MAVDLVSMFVPENMKLKSVDLVVGQWASPSQLARPNTAQTCGCAPLCADCRLILAQLHTDVQALERT